MTDSELPARGAVFWPVGTGDSSTIVLDDEIVVQVDLHDLVMAQDEDTPHVPVVDRLIEALPTRDGEPYLAVFALTHADKDHCLGFENLLSRVRIGELWATPRMWREFADPDAPEPCPDAKAFQDESERRVAATKKAVAAGKEPASGDRILVIGYDTDHDDHAYSELPDKYLSGPGKSVSTLDEHDCSDRFEVFFHAPFVDDCASERNETSLAMQITLTDDSGVDGKMLLFGDLAHDTIMKIFNYSVDHGRPERLEWDLLLAPHHCSKKVMYSTVDGKDVLHQDVLDAFSANARHNDVVIVSSSDTFRPKDEPGMNPPHRKARDRYQEIAELICTMSWGDEKAPSPVVFGVDASGARIVRESVSALSASAGFARSATLPSRRRLAAVTSAAVTVAQALPAAVGAQSQPTGPERVQDAIAADRGGASAPAAPVGFGR
ncbi:hypothetical protein [Rhodococcus pyridinivorans]|uniref:hypothetical protein n=1 Tax=Rhodococcus pyridinivorans TaxID=103816 RepID=UPI002078D83F|nr:hypothetical protein [Rhodococcus pyridinivorans]USI93018.1 hypothetical protein LLA01_24235 [Rhodococcus pyridinivorans]